MEEWMVRRYVGELRKQVGYAMSACAAVDAALTSYNNKEVFRNLHSFLTHSACISKMLWPEKAKCKARGEHLRTLLGVNDSFSGLSNRDLRNSLDHFDERLDVAFSEGHGKVFIDSNIGPPGAVFGAPESLFRNYDPNSTTYTFRGEAFQLREITGDIERLWQAISGGVSHEEPAAPRVVPFRELFSMAKDGFISPRRTLRVSGLPMNESTGLGRGFKVGKKDLHYWWKAEALAEVRDLGDLLEVVRVFEAPVAAASDASGEQAAVVSAVTVP